MPTIDPDLGFGLPSTLSSSSWRGPHFSTQCSFVGAADHGFGGQGVPVGESVTSRLMENQNTGTSRSVFASTSVTETRPSEETSISLWDSETRSNIGTYLLSIPPSMESV